MSIKRFALIVAWSPLWLPAALACVLASLLFGTWR